jgi:hypothetical protein
MADAIPARHQRPYRLAKSREQFVQAMRARAGRFRIVFWILVLLLPQLILVLLNRR